MALGEFIGTLVTGWLREGERGERRVKGVREGVQFFFFSLASRGVQ